MVSANVGGNGIVALILGASQFPLARIAPSESFANSARAFLRYLRNEMYGLGLPADNILDLFDSPRAPSGIDSEIASFLDRHTDNTTDVLVYYVGHGDFTRSFLGNRSDYLLALRCTTRTNPGISSLRMTDLAKRLVEGSRHARHYIILDACFAAAASSVFLGATSPTIPRGVASHPPKKGTALLCSSGPTSPSKTLDENGYTVFSGALINVLRHGDFTHKGALTLYKIRENIENFLRDRNTDGVARPEVHSPDQGEGDVADHPFFPNVALRFPDGTSSDESLQGARTVQIWISQLFQIADLHIFPQSVRAKKFLEAISNVNKMRRVLNRRSQFQLGDLGSVRPVVTIANKMRQGPQHAKRTKNSKTNHHSGVPQQSENFWNLGIPDFRNPSIPQLWFLPFELSLTEKLSAHTYSAHSLLGEILGQSDRIVSNKQISGRLRIYPPGVGIIRLGITLTFKDAVHIRSVTRIARDVEQLLFVDPTGLERPCEELLLEIIDSVANALFSENKLNHGDRRWRPPETIYCLHDDHGFDPLNEVSGLAQIMSRAPRNQEDEGQLEGRIRAKLDAVAWQKDRILATVGEGVALLFLEAPDTQAKRHKREKLLYWLEETAEVISAAAYAEKALVEEIKKISTSRMLDESWLPQNGDSFDFLFTLIRTIKTVLQATVQIKMHLESRRAGVLVTFANDIWSYNNPLNPKELYESLPYIEEWVVNSEQNHHHERLGQLASFLKDISAISKSFFQLSPTQST